jgi:hypothetical protein
MLDKRPLGTQYDVCRPHQKWLHHSVAPKAPRELFAIMAGGPDCTKSYAAPATLSPVVPQIAA